MSTPNLVVATLFASASVLLGAAWACTAVIHAKVIRSTALPQVSIWNLWSQVSKAYRLVCPGGRLLFWRSLFQILGLSSFIAMLVALVAFAIASKPH